MKNLDELQLSVRLKDKLNIIIEEEVIKSLNSAYTEDFFSPVYKRIFENFAKQEKINLTVLVNKKPNGFKKSSIIFLAKKKFKPQKVTENKEYQHVYIGYNKETVELYKETDVTTVGISVTDDEMRKSYKILAGKSTFETFLTETNNLYL